MRAALRLISLSLWAICGSVWSAAASAFPAFEISFPASSHSGPLSGRLILIISREDSPEVRLQPGLLLPKFGRDVERLQAEEVAVIDDETPGYPVPHLGALPTGEYTVQVLLNVYTAFHRADGHV